MARKPLKCNHCGQKMKRESGAGLHCGDDCAKAHETALIQAEADLIAQGFEPTETPNIFVKDEVAVTLHEVKNAGLDKAMARHSQVSELRNAERSAQGIALAGAAHDAADGSQRVADQHGTGESLRPASNQRGRRTGKA